MKSIQKYGTNIDKWEDVGLSLTRKEKQTIVNYIKTNFQESDLTESIIYIERLQSILSMIKNGNNSILSAEYQQRCNLNGWNLVCELNLMNEIVVQGIVDIENYLSNPILFYQINHVNKITSKECQILYLKSRIIEMKKAIYSIYVVNN